MRVTHITTYQGITALTGAAGDSQWGSATADPDGRGWWLTGTRNTGGTGCVADCKTMDIAYVPLTALTDPSAWHVRLGALPSGEGYDLGTVVSMSHVTGHGWVAYTKRNNITGSVLERLNAWHVTGPWHVATQQWQATPAPGCGWTYSAQAHPASPAPAGRMLVSWASSHDDPGTTCDMQPQFTDLPIGSPNPAQTARDAACARPTRASQLRCPGNALQQSTPAECSLTHNAPTRPEPENRHASADPGPENSFADSAIRSLTFEWPSHCVMGDCPLPAGRLIFIAPNR